MLNPEWVMVLVRVISSPAWILFVSQTMARSRSGSTTVTALETAEGRLVIPGTVKAGTAEFVIDTPDWLVRQFRTIAGISTVKEANPLLSNWTGASVKVPLAASYW